MSARVRRRRSVGWVSLSVSTCPLYNLSGHRVRILGGGTLVLVFGRSRHRRRKRSTSLCFARALHAVQKPSRRQSSRQDVFSAALAAAAFASWISFALAVYLARNADKSEMLVPSSARLPSPSRHRSRSSLTQCSRSASHLACTPSAPNVLDEPLSLCSVARAWASPAGRRFSFSSSACRSRPRCASPRSRA